MKRYKIRPKHSYYYYKKKKNMRIRIYILMSVLLGIILTFCFTGRFTQALDELSKMTFNKFEQNADRPQALYLDTPDIRYDLYRSPVIAKAIYVPANKLKDYEAYIQLVKETDINALVIDVKNDKGYLTFASEQEDLKEMGCVLDKPPIEDMRFIINRLYEEGVYPIARIVAFKDNVVARKMPEQAIQDLQGNLYVNKANDTWLNPYDTRNWDYLLQVSREAIQMGFKEIQFDYVRFHESMNAQSVKLDDTISKTDIITSFMKYMYEHLSAEGVYVSADVFGAIITSKIDSEIVGQDFKALSQHLDYICPMVYPSHYAKGTFGIEYPHVDAYGIILKSMEYAQDELKKIPRAQRRAIIRPWLQDFTLASLKPYQLYGPQQIKAQIQATYDAGLNEWIFWNASGKYTQAGLDDQ